jgi:C4-dicarboxylate-binding protein DctP
MKKLTAILTMVLLAGLMAATAQAGALGLDKPIELRFAYGEPDSWPGKSNYAPFPEEAMAKYFKAYVESRSNGMIKVKLLGNSIMGSNKQVTEMVRSGSLDLCTSTGSMGSMFPAFDMIYLPYVFRSEEVAWWVFDNSKFWKELMLDMEKKTNMVYLGMGQNGVRNFTNNVRPIKKPEDLNGLKIRVMESPIYVKMMDALGAQATPIGWNELYTSLQTKVVDGEENPVSIICAGKLYEVQKYLTLDGHTWSEDLLVMNAPKFHKLPAEARQLIMAAGRRAAVAGRQAEEYNTLLLKMPIVQKDMEVYTPTADEIAKFKSVARPPVEKWLRNRVGDELVDGFLNAVTEAETALGYQK